MKFIHITCQRCFCFKLIDTWSVIFSLFWLAFSLYGEFDNNLDVLCRKFWGQYQKVMTSILLVDFLNYWLKYTEWWACIAKKKNVLSSTSNAVCSNLWQTITQLWSSFLTLCCNMMRVNMIKRNIYTITM